MPNISFTTIIILVIFAIIATSVIFNWRRRAALKPNLAQIRHETEAEILKEQENEKEET